MYLTPTPTLAPAVVKKTNFKKCIISTPVVSTPVNFSAELKQALIERNLLTAKTRKKVCSMLTDSPSSSPMNIHYNNEADKRHQFRLQAIEEIFTSEKSYLSQLESLIKYFITPLKDKKVISEKNHTTLFGQIEMIYNLNLEFVKELEKNLDNVAKAFIKMAPFFKLYSVYAFDYKNGLLLTQYLIGSNVVLRKFLQDTESRPEVHKKLHSLMITPIQRVPRYKLLLEQVLLYTSPADPDYKLLKESVKQIEQTVTHINSVVEDQEITQMLLNLQNSLVNRQPNIVKPSRKIIKEGILFKVNRNGEQIKRYCILMSDIFMYCKILKERSIDTAVENSLECCCIFPLKKCKVYELFSGNFKISCQGDGIILCANDLYLSQSWVSSVKDAIDTHVECRKTLRKESSKRTPMRKKHVKNFDAEFILSPNRRRPDYETVFRINSDSDDDLNSSKKILCLKKNSFKNILKRKNSNSTNCAKKSYVSALETKKQMSRLKSFIKIPRGKPSTETEVNDINDKDYDPTYGFAKYSDTQSYFRTTNVDNTIPNSILRPQFQIVEDNGTSSTEMDSLYPLRKPKNDEYLISENFLSTNNRNFFQNKENGLEIEIQRKRVKFNDLPKEFPSSSSSLEMYWNPYYESKNENATILNSNKPKAFEFDVEEAPKETLKQRILNFFSKLF